MPDRDETEEPLQLLPPGMARRYAEYKPATDEPSPPPTNVGGYDELLKYVRGKGIALPRSREGLAVIDALSEGPEAKKDLTGLTAAIGEYVSLIQDRCDGLNQDHPTTRRLLVTV
ncbi:MULTISPECIES: hypothetical protein [unclassified Arthrobacter]|uniref:hypothetical protein n=1 Tax=unclassified Arthrobacter TaxID=235627 RepID=UPI001F202EEB|nr:hypothetical protein [Arthrobacter sp. FW306-06-A]UKA73075.1 hypothetical protein LFT49_10310 [Arthrobacter sp. FW306-06-A]